MFAGKQAARQIPQSGAGNATHGAGKDDPRLLLHGVTMSGGGHAEALFHPVIDVSDRQGPHGKAPAFEEPLYHIASTASNANSTIGHIDSQPALRGFFIFDEHVDAGLAHGLDDFVE